VPPAFTRTLTLSILGWVAVLGGVVLLVMVGCRVPWRDTLPGAGMGAEIWRMLALLAALAAGLTGIALVRLQALSAQREYRATHHELTELPNYLLLQQRVSAAIAAARENPQRSRHIALLYLDLHRFKAVNDAYGHAFGTRVLKAAGAALTRLVGPQGTVAHLSGDRFLILLADLREASDAERLAQHVLTGLKHPLVVDAVSIPLTATVGVSVYPQHGETVDALVSHADLAGYAAKRAGRGVWRIYTDAMGEAVQRRSELEACLRAAIEANPNADPDAGPGHGNPFHLVYQPKIHLASGRITGCEALVRWTHPVLGEVAPACFIPIAEESGLIMPLGDWVLNAVCRQARAWRDAGLVPVRIAVNLSLRQFLHQDVVAWVADALARHQLPASCLELEITESLLPHDLEHAIATLARLRALGVTLALDDFGTGYANLSTLKRFPVHVLKIDQSFVRNAATTPADAAIVRAILTLARALSFTTLAEGVETDAQLQFFRTHGCDGVQGYHISAPLRAGAFAALLERNAETQRE